MILKNIFRNEGAQALVETAIAFPILILFIAGIIELTLVFISQQVVEYSAFCAARTGIVYYKIDGKSRKLIFDTNRMKISASIACIPVSEKISFATKKYKDIFMQRKDDAEKEINNFIQENVNKQKSYIEEKDKTGILKKVLPEVPKVNMDVKPVEDAWRWANLPGLGDYWERFATAYLKTYVFIKDKPEKKYPVPKKFGDDLSVEVVYLYKPKFGLIGRLLQYGVFLTQVPGVRDVYKEILAESTHKVTEVIEPLENIYRETMTAKATVEKAIDEIENARLDISTVEEKLKQSKQELENLKARIKDNEKAGIESVINQVKSDYQKVTNDIQNLKKSRDELIAEKEKLEKYYPDIDKAKQAKDAFVDSTRKEAQESYEKVKKDLQDVENSMSKLVGRKTELEEDIKNPSAVLKKIGKGESVVSESTLNEIDNSYNKIEKNIQDIEKSKEKLNAQKQALERCKNDIMNSSLPENDVNKVKEIVTSDLNSIQNSYNVITGAKDRLYENRKYIDNSVTDIDNTMKTLEKNKEEISKAVPNPDRIYSNISSAGDEIERTLPKIDEQLYNIVNSNKYVQEGLKKIDDAQKKYTQIIESIFDYSKFPFVPLIGHCTLSVELPYP